MSDPAVLGTFGDPARAARAVEALRSAGYRVEAALPAPFPEVMAALGKPRSRLGRVTFAGAVLGFAAGVVLTVGTSVAWPLVTGGKPIVSWPPFVVNIFEVTVLVGSIVNLVALAVTAGRGARAQRRVARAVGPGERIVVVAAGGEMAAAARLLREGGAEEVHDAA